MRNSEVGHFAHLEDHLDGEDDGEDVVHDVERPPLERPGGLFNCGVTLGSPRWGEVKLIFLV